MTETSRFLFPCIGALAICLASAATGQELALPDLLNAFKTQKIVTGATRSPIGVLLHRGLVLVPSDADQTDVGSAEVKEIRFRPVPENEQVNIRISFDLNSSDLRNDQLARLVPLCKAMTIMDDTRFRIIGHTDASGPDTYNDLLSVHRAMSVRDHLVGHCGIKTARLEAVGVGERYLADASNPRSQRNRRVEFQAITQAAETQ
ncbi:MAG: OmpA family protein [Paracoccaceae bacterium]